MSATSESRLQHLVAWLRAHRRDAINEHGEPRLDWLVDRTGKSMAYWSDVMRIPRSGKSFCARAARSVEQALGMPDLCLEGAGSDWPFDAVERERFERLTPRQKGRVEEALRQAIERVESEADASSKPPRAA